MGKMTLRFRLCNLLYRDYLRNYLAVDAMVLKQVAELLENGHVTEAKELTCARRLRSVRGDLLWLMSGEDGDGIAK